MPAATQQVAQIKANISEMANAAVRNLLDEQPKSGYATIHVFAEQYVVPTTAIDDVNDILQLLRFPAGAYIWFLRVTASDMDTNATPTLAFSVLATDTADATKATLISASTIGQAGGTAVLADAGIGEFVGDYFLSLKTTAVSATPAAGTVSVLLGYSIGVSTVTGSATNNPRLTDIAL